MKIAMIGSGYVGLVSGACFADFGHDVVCVDNDATKVAALMRNEMPIYEPGLDDVVERNRRAGRLTFTVDLAGALVGATAVFIAVGTPTRRGDGHADLSYVIAAATDIARSLRQPTLVVTKSTVPVGTCAGLRELVRRERPDLAIDVASNPEFLREGSAIEDFSRPDRIVCGVTSQEARQILTDVYKPLYINQTPLLFTTPETSELIKYAANCFLATKITFINELADLCERVGADVQQVAKGLGSDRRIGDKFLHAGPGFGGSCFPKDILALLRTAELADSPLRIVETVANVNESRKRRMVKKVLDAAGGSVAGKTIGVLGVTFKPNTDDMRDSPSLVILPALQAEGASIQAFDPAGMANAAALLPGVTWRSDAYDALDGADVALLLTEWNQFRGLDLERVRARMRGAVFVDLRNVYDPATMGRLGFAYTGVGKPPAAAPTSTALAAAAE